MKPFKRTTSFRSLLLLFVLAWSSAISAQQDRKVVSYGFVSPNTSQNLKLQQAITGMHSPAESKLRNEAINLSCVVRTRIDAFPALGSWKDGAEHSLMVRFTSDEETLRYVVSRLGRDAQQKYVIYFHPVAGGKVDLYTLRPRTRRNLVALSNELERAGIPCSTIVPLGEATAIYIIDLDRDLRPKIMSAAQRLRARVSQEAGNAKLFGDDERDKAKLKFEQEIKDYETRNPNLPPTCDVQRKVFPAKAQRRKV